MACVCWRYVRGSTESQFHEIAGTSERAHAQPRQTAEAVVETGLAALAQGRGHVVSGWNNWLMIQSERFVPRHVVINAAQKLFKQFAKK